MGPEAVLILLARLEVALQDWFRNQAPETLKGRLTQREFEETIQALIHDDHIKFTITLIYFLHEEFVRGSPSYPHHLESRLTLSRDPSRARSLTNSSSTKMGMPVKAVQDSKVNNLQKYDLGYVLYVQEKLQQEMKGGGGGPDGGSPAVAAVA